MFQKIELIFKNNALKLDMYFCLNNNYDYGRNGDFLIAEHTLLKEVCLYLLLNTANPSNY